MSKSTFKLRNLSKRYKKKQEMIKIAGFPFSPEFDRPIQRKSRDRRYQPYSISQEMITPTTWSARVDLASFPTQKEDLKITKDESKRAANLWLIKNI